MRILFSICCLVVGLSFAPVAGWSQDQRELADYLDQSVGRVLTRVKGGTGRGSGYVVSKGDSKGSYFFLTNHHVIDDGLSVEVVYAGTKQLYRFSAEVLRSSTKHDMALLRIVPKEGHDFEPEALSLASYAIERGDEVYAVGFPGFADDFLDRRDELARYEPTLTSGIVGKRFNGKWGRNGVSVEQLQHNAAINAGNSGGPLVSPCGIVVGLNTAKPIEDVDGAFFSSSAQTIRDFLDGTVAKPDLVSRTCSSWSNVLSDPKVLGSLVGAGLLALVLGGYLYSRRQTATATPGAPVAMPEPAPTRVASAFAKPFRKTVALRVSIQGKSVPLEPDALTRGVVIGRGGGSDIDVDHVKLSRRHVELRVRSRKLYIIDLGSTNGTTVDGKKLSAKSAVQINTRSRILLGGVPLNLAKGD